MRIHCCALLAAFAGCGFSGDPGDVCGPFGTGEEPCRQQLYFPSGIAVDPDGEALYVTSFNADLRYAGGAVHAIDLPRFECAVAFRRTGEASDECRNRRYVVEGKDTLLGGSDPRTPDQRRARCPQVDRSAGPGTTLLASDAACCRADVHDPRIIECDEAPFMASAVKIGNFGRSLRVQERTSGEFNRRLWTAVRGEDAIFFIDAVKVPGQPAILTCSGVANPAPGTHLDSCAKQRITLRDPQPEVPGEAVPAPDPLPVDPFELVLDKGALADGTPYERLVAVHLAGGEVTLIDAKVDDPALSGSKMQHPRVVLDVRGGFFSGDGIGRRGAWAAAPRSPGVPDSYWYLTSRLSQQVALFRVDGDRIVSTAGFIVGGAAAGAFAVGDDVRDVAFDPGDPPRLPAGERAFFLQNRPPALFTVDTRIASAPGSKAGLPENRIVDVVSVCQGPVRLRLTTAPTRVYVVCFADTQLVVVDPDLGAIDAAIPVGQGGQEIAFDRERAPRRAYVTSFTASSVQVIDVDRASPGRGRVIARIGTTSPPVGR